MRYIRLATTIQALLFNLELKGQVSDGYWENAKPRDHYKAVCAAEVVVDPDNVGLDFYPSRRYNFTSPQLIEYVGDRMQQYILLAKKYPTLSATSLRHTDSGEWIWQIKVGEESPKWQVAFHKEMAEVCGVHNYHEMQLVLAGLDKTDYPMKELRKDLKAINAAFKILSH
jgi:hypothetical protein